MENTNGQEDAQKHIERLTRPIFNRVLQEANSNSMTTTRKTYKILWRPNNYRRKIKVDFKKGALAKEIKGVLPLCHMERSNNLLFIKDYKGITIQYGREILTAIYSQRLVNGEKEVFQIEGKSVEEVEEKILSRRDAITKQIDEALNSFIDKFRIRVPGEEIRWCRYEDWIKGEEFIDKIPENLIIHDTFFKKVYGQGIEFKKVGDEDPGVHMKNYIKNRALEDHSGVAVEELIFCKEMIHKILDVLDQQAELGKDHARLNRETAAGLNAVGRVLKSFIRPSVKPERRDPQDPPEYVG